MKVPCRSSFGVAQSPKKPTGRAKARIAPSAALASRFPVSYAKMKYAMGTARRCHHRRGAGRPPRSAPRRSPGRAAGPRPPPPCRADQHLLQARLARNPEVELMVAAKLQPMVHGLSPLAPQHCPGQFGRRDGQAQRTSLVPAPSRRPDGMQWSGGLLPSGALGVKTGWLEGHQVPLEPAAGKP